jgi:3-methylcrotonyl-CoA carboxylase alpha subunit
MSAPARWSSSPRSCDDGDRRFYFMEMNTRLQVEHPVTEAITGLDLVEWQLRVAAGEPLPLRQDELRDARPRHRGTHLRREPRGRLPARHRAAARCCAGRPHVAFERDEPSGVDTGVGEGDAISPYYDSMIAKLIVWGEDRAQALARLDAALRDTHIVGLHTNVAFLRRVVASQPSPPPTWTPR